jgi:hypothetical protein
MISKEVCISLVSIGGIGGKNCLLNHALVLQVCCFYFVMTVFTTVGFGEAPVYFKVATITVCNKNSLYN